MKHLTERTEIAKALNFGKYPVLTFDLHNQTEYGFKGCKCRIDMGTFNDGSNYYETAELYAYRDEQKVTFNSFGCCLSAEWSYHDFVEDLEYANAPLVEPNGEVVIVILDTNLKLVYEVIIAKVGKAHKFCSTPIDIEEIDMSKYFKLTVYSKE